MIKNIAIAIAALIAAVLIFAATRPDSFRVERSALMKAPPEKVFNQINDFHAWGAWSPWEKLDPAMTRTFSGAQAGKGAIYEWKGNKDVGRGRMEVTASTSPGKTVIALDFLEPFEAHNTTEFTITPDGTGSKVSWAMYGPSPYISKLMGLVMSMDSLVGKDFEKGLSNLMQVVEK